MPKVSVIIPTYNRAKFLQAAIRSVLDQTFQDYEILVVDDCSKDDTEAAVHRFLDPRIRYLRNENNKGEGGSRNVGLRHARGELIALLDDDDEWLPEKLELQVAILDRSPSRVGAVYSGYYRIDRATGKLWGKSTRCLRGDIFDELLTENWIVPSTLLLRKECFDKAGRFEEGMKFGADYDMWIRVAGEFHFECIAAPLVRYYLHGNNVTADAGIVIRGIENQLEKYASLWQSNPKGRSKRYLTLGVLYCYTGEMRKGRAALLKAISLWPTRFANYFNLCLSLLGTGAFRVGTDVKERITTRMRELRPFGSGPNPASN